jgi:WD40 repeat protein
VELALPPALAHGGSNVQAAALASAPDGADLVATGNDTGTLRLMRREPDGTWSLLCRFQPSGKPILDLAFAPDGSALAAASEDGRATLVDISERTCGQPRFLDGGTTTLYSVAFSPDGATLVTASLDGRAQVWSTKGQQLADLVGHKDRVYYAEFSPDGRWLLTASRDGAVRVWERPGSPTAGGQPAVARPETQGTADAAPVQGSYLVLDGKLGGVAYARFSPDGHSIAAAYWENAAVLWRLWTEDPNPDPAQAATWGTDRARLTLIREAYRFRDDIAVTASDALKQPERQ